LLDNVFAQGFWNFFCAVIGENRLLVAVTDFEMAAAGRLGKYNALLFQPALELVVFYEKPSRVWR